MKRAAASLAATARVPDDPLSVGGLGLLVRTCRSITVPLEPRRSRQGQVALEGLLGPESVVRVAAPEARKRIISTEQTGDVKN
jgi:hypothetical protein